MARKKMNDWQVAGYTAGFDAYEWSHGSDAEGYPIYSPPRMVSKRRMRWFQIKVWWDLKYRHMSRVLCWFRGCDVEVDEDQGGPESGPHYSWFCKRCDRSGGGWM